MIAEWGVSAAEPRDLARRDFHPLALAAFGPTLDGDRQAGLAQLLTDRSTRPAPLDAPALADLAALAEPAWVDLLDGPPVAPSWTLAAAERSARADAPRAPSAPLRSISPGGCAATA